MRVRDAIMVVVAVLFCIVAWSQEGSLRMRRVFRITLDADDEGVRTHLPPRPVLVDPSGRGQPVLVASSSYGQLGLYDVQRLGKYAGGVTGVPQLQPSLTVAVGANIIGLAAGTLRHPHRAPAQRTRQAGNTTTTPPAAATARATAAGATRLVAVSSVDEVRGRLVAVVTSDYVLTAVEVRAAGEARVLWTTLLAPRSAWVQPIHAAVAVLPERVHADDGGMVTVAIAVLDGDSQAELTLFAAYNGVDGALRWSYVSDAGSEADDVLKEAAAAAATTTLVETANNNAKDAATAAAAAATRGTTASPDERAAAAVAAVLTPDEAEQLLHVTTTTTTTTHTRARMHVTRQRHRTLVQPWTKYRDAVIAALPHRYDHPWDAQLRPHVFVTTRRRTPRATGATAAQQQQRQQRRRRTSRIALGVPSLTLHYGTFVLRVQGKAAALREKLRSLAARNDDRTRRDSTLAAAAGGRAVLPANALVYHGVRGVEVVHLYTGRHITSLVPLQAYTTYYDDVNDDRVIEAVSTQMGGRLSTHRAMDALAGYGVEVRHDCFGTVHTGIPVASHVLYRAPICTPPRLLGGVSRLLRRLADRVAVDDDKDESAMAAAAAQTAGDTAASRTQRPPRLRRSWRRLRRWASGGAKAMSRHAFVPWGGDGNAAAAAVAARRPPRAVMPLVVQLRSAYADVPGFTQVERLVVYMLRDSGLVTCVSPTQQRVLWRTLADSQQTMFVDDRNDDEDDDDDNTKNGKGASGVAGSARTLVVTRVQAQRDEDTALAAAAVAAGEQPPPLTAPRQQAQSHAAAAVAATDDNTTVNAVTHDTNADGDAPHRHNTLPHRFAVDDDAAATATLLQRDGRVRAYPHLAPYTLHGRVCADDDDCVAGGEGTWAYRRTQPYVLAVREAFMTALHTRTGRVAARVALGEADDGDDAVPIAPVLVVDFNGDGVNDVLVVSRRYMDGYACSTQASSESMAALMVLMLALLLLLFVTREVHMQQRRQRRGRREAERQRQRSDDRSGGVNNDDDDGDDGTMKRRRVYSGDKDEDDDDNAADMYDDEDDEEDDVDASDDDVYALPRSTHEAQRRLTRVPGNTLKRATD